MSGTDKSDAVGKTLEDLKGAGDAVRQAGGQATQAGTDAIGQAKDVAQDAMSRAGSVAGALGDKAAAVAESQKSQLADKLEDVAKAVHRSSEALEGQQEWVAHMVERGAAELSTLATTLRTNDLQSLLGDLGSLARRQPALFVGASMAAGFALTRVGRLAVSAPAHAAPASPATMSVAPTPPATSRVIPAAEPGGAMEVTRERQ
jgi:hypothetical protein